MGASAGGGWVSIYRIAPGGHPFLIDHLDGGLLGKPALGSGECLG
ncbi:MAG: hypothetical protein WA724_04260 [Candidatus Dormiibacterota bacterium]